MWFAKTYFGVDSKLEFLKKLIILSVYLQQIKFCVKSLSPTKNNNNIPRATHTQLTGNRYVTNIKMLFSGHTLQVTTSNHLLIMSIIDFT